MKDPSAVWLSRDPRYLYFDSSTFRSHIHCSLLRRAAIFMLFFETKRTRSSCICCHKAGWAGLRTTNEASEAVRSSSGLLRPMPDLAPRARGDGQLVVTGYSQI